MDIQYKKCVLNMKNGYGRSICVIAEENNGQTTLLMKDNGTAGAYIYKKSGYYEKGRNDGGKYIFPKTRLEDMQAVVIGGFDNDGRAEKNAFVGFKNGAFELKPYKPKDSLIKEEKAERHMDMTPQKEEKHKKEIPDADIKEEKEKDIPPVTEEKMPEERGNEEKREYEGKKPEREKIQHEKEENHKYSSVIKEYESIKKQNSAQDNLKKIIDIFAKEMTELEKTGILKKDEISYIETGVKNEDACKTDRLFEKNTAIEPFENSPYDWVMVSMDEMWRTGIKKCSCVLNPMVMLSEIKYHHLALGKNRETGNVVFAVPEEFCEADRKSAKELGFKDFWFCSRETSPFGYWIMDI